MRKSSKHHGVAGRPRGVGTEVDGEPSQPRARSRALDADIRQSLAALVALYRAARRALSRARTDGRLLRAARLADDARVIGKWIQAIRVESGLALCHPL